MRDDVERILNFFKAGIDNAIETMVTERELLKEVTGVAYSEEEVQYLLDESISYLDERLAVIDVDEESRKGFAAGYGTMVPMALEKMFALGVQCTSCGANIHVIVPVDTFVCPACNAENKAPEGNP